MHYIFPFLLFPTTALASPSNDNYANMLYFILLLGFLALGYGSFIKRNPGTALKYIGLWGLIIIGLVGLYSFRFEFIGVKNRIKAELLPSTALVQNDGSIVIRASEDGHFHLKLHINGKEIHGMIDTGASDIALNKADAKTIGIDMDTLEFNKIFHTANGTTRGASVVLNSLTVGDISWLDVKASVNEGELGQTLLGMRFLDMFSSYEVKNDTLTLQPIRNP